MKNRVAFVPFGYPQHNTNTMSSANSVGDTRVPVLKISRIRTELAYFKSVHAGFPSPADDYLEEKLNLDNYLIKNPASTFFIRADGESMTGAGIYPEDILIVDRSLQAKSKDVIVAWLNGDFTLKRLVYEQGRCWLRPENPQFKAIEVIAENDFIVWGVVTHVIHQPYEL
jgi:DNA polymerase V